MKKKYILLIPGLLLGAGAAAYFGLGLHTAPRIAPGSVPDPGANRAPPRHITQAAVLTITEWYEAVGTVRPRTETRIEAQVTAQIKEVHARPGSKVTKGQMLVTLDNRGFLSRLDQAKEGLKTAIAGKKQADQAVLSARASFNQAESDFKRIQTYFRSQAATSQDLERAESAYLQAKAEVQRSLEALAGAEARIRQAQEVVREAEIALGYTQIRAPEEGEVLNRLVEPGDMALPGKPLMLLQTRGTLRIEAHVREGLIQKIRPGVELEASIDTLGLRVPVTVQEIVPYADPQTRTFLVKAALPPAEGLYPGMFGKLLIPADQHPVVAAPQRAVRKVGQLELVTVKAEGGWETRYVKTGRSIDSDLVEILSGLDGNETIVLEG